MQVAFRNDQIRQHGVSSRDCLKLVFNIDDLKVDAHSNNRTLVALLTLVLLMGLCSLALDNMRARRVEALLDAAPHSLVQVIEGDTLWDIATKNRYEGTCTQEVMDWIFVRNHLESSALMPGQRIIVPGKIAR